MANVSNSNPSERARELIRRALAAAEQDRHGDALADLREAERLAVDADDRGLLAATRINQGYVYQLQGDTEAALRLFSEASRIASADHDERRLKSALANLSVAFRRAERHAEAEETLSDYLALVSGDATARATALLDRGLCRVQLGMFDGALEDFEQARSLAIDSEDRDLAISAGLNLGAACEEQGDSESAFEAYQRVAEIARDAQREDVRVVALVGLGKAHRRFGQTPEALEAFRQAVEAARAVEDGPTLAEALHWRATVLNDAGSTSAAFETWREEEAILRGLGADAALGDCLVAQADACLFESDWAKARSLYDQAEELYRSLGPSIGFAEALYGHARLLRRSGDSVGALAKTHEALAIISQSPDPAMEAKVRGLSVMALADIGDIDAAMDESTRSQIMCMDHDLAGPGAWARARRAYVLACDGAPAEEVVQQLRNAFEHARDRGVESSGSRAVRKVTAEIVKRHGDVYGPAVSALADEVRAASEGDTSEDQA